MSVIEYIGDEASAAGYRLSGIDVRVADAGDTLLLVRQACARASMVLIGSAAAKNIHKAELDELLKSVYPSVLVVPDIRGLEELPDITSLIYKQLGMVE